VPLFQNLSKYALLWGNLQIKLAHHAMHASL